MRRARAVLFLCSMTVLVSVLQPRAPLVPIPPEQIQTDLMPLLTQAAEDGRVDEVRRLLESGADVKEKQEDPTFTPLMLAVKGGHVEVVKLLLKAGADPNAFFGIAHVGFFTPLNMAVGSQIKNRLELIDTLVAGGALLNPPPTFHESPLVAAVTNNDIEMIKALLERGSDVNWEDKFGGTALETAATMGDRSVEVVRLLLSAGADPNKPRIWDRDDCLSLLKSLDDELKMSRQMRLPRDKVREEIARLIEEAGGKKFTKKSHNEPCKPWTHQ